MVLCFTGWSCTGKTTVSKVLEENFSYILLSVRNISHELAIENGYSRTREWLKNTDIKTYLKECREKIIEIIKKLPDNNIVIDDLFDWDLYLELNKKFDTRLVLFTVSEEDRLPRIKQRTGFDDKVSKKELQLLDSYKIDFGIEKVMKDASITINTTSKSAFDIATVIQEFIK